MKMKYLHTIKKMLCAELEKISNDGELSAGALDTIHKLTDTIKNIDKIVLLEEDGGYSQDGSWEARGMYRDGGSSYEDGASSYRRKRDRMGRYSRDGGGNSGGNSNYSREGGKEHLIEQMEELMDEAENPKEKEAIRRCINNMRIS